MARLRQFLCPGQADHFLPSCPVQKGLHCLDLCTRRRIKTYYHRGVRYAARRGRVAKRIERWYCFIAWDESFIFGCERSNKAEAWPYVSLLQLERPFPLLVVNVLEIRSQAISHCISRGQRSTKDEELRVLYSKAVRLRAVLAVVVL